MAGQKGMTHYPIEIKLEAVRMFLEEGQTRAEIAHVLGLRSAGRVKIWVSQYRHEKDAFRKTDGRPRNQGEGVDSAEEELKRLRMENDLLKKLHAELRKEKLAKRDIGSFNTKDKPTQ